MNNKKLTKSQVDLQKARIKSFMELPENKAYFEAEKAQLAKEVLIKRFKEMRKSKGLTQKDVAKILGVEQPEVSRIESGKDAFSMDKFLLFITALNGRLELIY
jgi:DNA-binding XRE family transcriptional regulator